MRAWFASLAITLAVVLFGLTAVVVPAAHAQPGVAEWTAARDASEAMEVSNYAVAQDLLLSMEALYPDHPAVDYVRGKYQFHMGDYAEALASLDLALARGGNLDGVMQLRELVASTLAVVGEFETYTTANGLFEIRYEAGRDEILLPWAEETLESAWYELGYDLGYWPEPPIRVEILPRALLLAQVSSLSEEAIRTSGTIALCKYNKLMVTSPRATARGYNWRDTISHEYVHYVVSHLVHQDLPIWLHEALAKYLEGRWTGSRNMVMDPSREDLLTRRVAADALITFEQMHPSMAYLPSAEDASTAYSQVFTISEYIVARRGVAAIRDWLYAVRDGMELEEAFTATFGESFPVFERSWMSYLRERPPVEIPGDFDDEIELLVAPEEGAEGSAGTAPDDGGLGSVQARDHLHLGELLRARGLVQGALDEYRRAELLVGTANPILQNALAVVLLDMQQAEQALQALTDVRGWHPGFYPSHLNYARALLELQRPQEALPALELAAGINPFDPAVHEAYATAWQALGNEAAAERARQYRQQTDTGRR